MRFPRWRVGLICRSMRNFLAGVISAGAIVGSATRQPFLMGVRESYIPMAPNTAIAFLVLGTGLSAIATDQIRQVETQKNQHGPGSGFVGESARRRWAARDGRSGGASGGPRLHPQAGGVLGGHELRRGFLVHAHTCGETGVGAPGQDGALHANCLSRGESRACNPGLEQASDQPGGVEPCRGRGHGHRGDWLGLCFGLSVQPRCSTALRQRGDPDGAQYGGRVRADRKGLSQMRRTGADGFTSGRNDSNRVATHVLR